jgi:hypothetical protein
MELAGDHFVIELAHGAHHADLDVARQSIRVPRGDVYDVHLHQNGADQWLLLWGSFDTIESARAARTELGSSTSSPLGFPRRIAPLQAEARNADGR